MKAFTLLLVITICTVGLAACGTDTADTPDTPDEPYDEPPAVSLPDTTGDAVWAHLGAEDYTASWALWPDKGELYAGTEPHGMLLTTYLNPTAMGGLEGDATALPVGSIIVKENYMPDSMLAAITVMVKREVGYNPDHADWFFTKILADGSVEAMEGMRAEGRVMMCQACHSGRADNDYLMTADIN